MYVMCAHICAHGHDKFLPHDKFLINVHRVGKNLSPRGARCRDSRAGDFASRVILS